MLAIPPRENYTSAVVYSAADRPTTQVGGCGSCTREWEPRWMGWGCAQTYGGQENRAIRNLALQGYEAICPRYEVPPERPRAQPSARPLFPSYVFIRIDPATIWTPIRSTGGVIRLLTSGSRLDPRVQMVPDSFIESLGALGVASSQFHARLEPGTVVRVRRLDSPVYDYVGSVVSMLPGQRVRVLMSLFNRDTAVELALPDLEVA